MRGWKGSRGGHVGYAGHHQYPPSCDAINQSMVSKADAVQVREEVRNGGEEENRYL